MFRLDVPIICTVIGRWLGGALAGVGERLLMFEHAVYTVATKPVPPFFGKMPAGSKPQLP